VQGVVTKTDIVRRISDWEGATCLSSVSVAMTREIVSCRTGDRLADVSQLMKEQHLKNIPVMDEDKRLLGVLTARAILRERLGELARTSGRSGTRRSADDQLCQRDRLPLNFATHRPRDRRNQCPICPDHKTLHP